MVDWSSLPNSYILYLQHIIRCNYWTMNNRAWRDEGMSESVKRQLVPRQSQRIRERPGWSYHMIASFNLAIGMPDISARQAGHFVLENNVRMAAVASGTLRRPVNWEFIDSSRKLELILFRQTQTPQSLGRNAFAETWIGEVLCYLVSNSAIK